MAVSESVSRARGERGVLSLGLSSLGGLLAVGPFAVVRLTELAGREKEVPPLTHRRCRPFVSLTRPQLGRDDPLNLSILLRGGKENNDDSLSKGD